jgi:hypothetical protein
MAQGSGGVSKSMAKKAYDLEFQPIEKQKSKFFWRFLIGFGSIVFILGGLSVFTLRQSGWFEQFGAETTLQTAESSNENTTWAYTGTATFLLSETSPDKTQLRFCALLTVDWKNRRFDIAVLNPAAFAAQQAEGGLRGLEQALQAKVSSAVFRGITSTDSTFVQAANLFGSVSVDIPERIQYRSEAFGLTLAQGQQRLQGDLLLRYLRWLALQGDLVQIGNVLSAFVDSALQSLKPEMLDSVFSKFVNALETDISARDFFDIQPALSAIVSDKNFLIGGHESGA